ncbi:bifunctional bis(5'-adenosyl)-triphosphatase/adenylylsulfatase FHIT [Rhododendron vialii]|uniref:bifunctional bis(5'-adenosyl)-triphosphatase/adenylylsulfatase FHIT n=1 Tax=Rhododendron vialii TaxID=182163 RepID=UPI00265FAC73|nr:bifunctional bis(5'-adenosyl)-triphosphatase/adenylylsulfatase FHIT [Rhododendron vialii]
MVKALKVLVPSLSSSAFRSFNSLCSSATLRHIAAAAVTSNNKSALNHHSVIARASSTYTRSKMESEHYTFGPYKISFKEVFYSTDLSYAMVNLRPVLPGHVLVCPRREVKRFADLTAEETSDLWLTAQKIGKRLEQHHKASSLTFTIQDGPQAGQSVPHVHIHILPRKGGDFQENDEIYDAIDGKEKELKQNLDLDKERKDRSFEEMAEEAEEYRRLLS